MSYENLYYRCVKEVSGTGARCRNRAATCPNHSADPSQWKAAAQPTHIEFGIELPFDWRSVFSKVEHDYRSWSDRMQRAAMHIQTAENIGRSTNAFVGQILRDGEMAPEYFHSGTPIFGDKGGLDRVDVTGTEAKMRAAGFVLMRIEVKVRSTGPVTKPPMLILYFARGTENVEFTEFPWDKFHELAEITMTYVHAWANIPQDDGSVVHTVNCLIDERRQHQKPKYALDFNLGDEGYWTAQPIAAPVPVALPTIANVV